MKDITLYVPSSSELGFRKECVEDPATMEYNAGYDVALDGYHYDTGCVDFPKSKWRAWFKAKIESGAMFFAYIKDQETKQFVGLANFTKSADGRAEVGIVVKHEFRGKGYMRPALEKLIEVARKEGVAVLANVVSADRMAALRVFYDFSFREVGRQIGKRFGKPEVSVIIEKTL